jgi:GxxExxY protein
MLVQDLKYSDLTGKIIGLAMQVHRGLGQGFPEIVYKRSLIIELKKLGLNYSCEEEKEIFYEGECVGKRRLDLIVDNKILIGLKSVKLMVPATIRL